jgi:CRISPR-associated protein Cas1
MLTLPDLKAKQILFIQTEHNAKNRLFFKNENIVFEKEEKIINQASCHRVLAVFVIGDFSFTSGLVKECKKRAVSLFFLGNNCGLYGSLCARADGNYILRSKQYKTTASKEFYIAKQLVKNKILNQMRLLKIDGKMEVDKMLAEAGLCKNPESLLGLEGNFSKIFFSEYFKEVGWLRRMPRVKSDIANSLLDMGYTFLFNFIDALLQLFGFDTYKGCYHKLFFQRKSLACDIIEPFRCIIERQILKSYHLKQINSDDFLIMGRRYVLSYNQSQKYAKIFMEAIMDSKEPLYLFVKKFYCHVMDEHNPFPAFDINTGRIE